MSIGLGNKPADCNAFAWRLNLSYDGRYVSFESCASNLVANDTNVENDTFVRDRRTNRTERVSVGLGGAQALGNDSPVAQTFLSADGRFVAFSSLAYNLVPNDQPSPAGKVDTFVYDRKLHKTERVSVSSAGVAANGTSYVSGISADGRFVLFATAASNLVPGDSNPDFDVFVHDRRTHQTECVSVVWEARSSTIRIFSAMQFPPTGVTSCSAPMHGNSYPKPATAFTMFMFMIERHT